LNGVAHAVPSAHIAQGSSCRPGPGGEIILVVVDPHAEGVEAERTVTTNREIHPICSSTSTLCPRATSWSAPRVGQRRSSGSWASPPPGCAPSSGICEAALRQTAAHLNEREQFGKPLSSFQGTMLRAADAAIDIEAMRVTLWEAAWRLDSGLDAREAVAVAKWQAAERGQGVVHATQHSTAAPGPTSPTPSTATSSGASSWSFSSVDRASSWPASAPSLPSGPQPEPAVSSGVLGTRTYDSVAVGDELERLVLPITPTLIVAGRSPAATTKTSTTTAPSHSCAVLRTSS